MQQKAAVKYENEQTVQWRVRVVKARLFQTIPALRMYASTRTQTHKHTLFKLHYQLVTRSVLLSAHKKSDVKWLKNHSMHSFELQQAEIYISMKAGHIQLQLGSIWIYNVEWMLTVDSKSTSIKKTKNKTVAHFRFIKHPDNGLCIPD